MVWQFRDGELAGEVRYQRVPGWNTPERRRWIGPCRVRLLGNDREAYMATVPAFVIPPETNEFTLPLPCYPEPLRTRGYRTLDFAKVSPRRIEVRAGRKYFRWTASEGGLMNFVTGEWARWGRAAEAGHAETKGR